MDVSIALLVLQRMSRHDPRVLRLGTEPWIGTETGPVRLVYVVDCSFFAIAYVDSASVLLRAMVFWNRSRNEHVG